MVVVQMRITPIEDPEDHFQDSFVHLSSAYRVCVRGNTPNELFVVGLIMQDHTPDAGSGREPDLNSKTLNFNTEPFIGERIQPDPGSGESLFENYERRSLRSIIEQQRAYRESQAAQAARAILHGAVLPEFTPYEHDSVVIEEFEDAEEGSSPAQVHYRRIRVQRISKFGRLASPGAQVVYVLLVVAVLGGMLGLAFSTDSAHMLLIAGIATPMLLPICVWRWLCWLDSSPYYYRLLTTLGEDARNLLHYRLLWKKSSHG